MIINNFEQLKPFRYKQGIYIFINKKDPTRKYAGKSCNLYNRIVNDHKNAKGYRFQYIDRVIKKYGLLEYFDIELFHWWDEYVSEMEVLALETAVIEEYQCLKQFGGYNLVRFGGSMTGFHHSKITKNKLKIANLNKKHSYESKEKIRLASLGNRNHFYGKTHSQKSINKMLKYHLNKKLTETHKEKLRKIIAPFHFKSGKDNPMFRKHVSQQSKDKLSKLNKGKKLSPQQINKLIESSRKANSKAIKQININNNQIIKIWESATKAAKFIGLKTPGGISNTIAKRTKSSGGFRWEYA